MAGAAGARRQGRRLFAMSCGAISLFVIGGSLVGLRASGMGADVLAIAAGKLLPASGRRARRGIAVAAMARDLQIAVVLIAAVPMLGIYPSSRRSSHDAMAAAAQLGTRSCPSSRSPRWCGLLKSGVG